MGRIFTDLKRSNFYPSNPSHPCSIFDFTAKRVQTAENAESTQRFREFFLGVLCASSANSAVKEVFAVDSFFDQTAIIRN